MRFKFTAFLLILNLLTFGFILYLGKESGSGNWGDQGLAEQLDGKLIEADQITLLGKDLAEQRILVREGTSWSLTEPMNWPANYFAVNRILNQLQFIEEEASFSIDELADTGQSLADYGLEDPALRLTISEDDNSVSLCVGTVTDIGNNVYLLGPEKKRIYVIDRRVIDGLLLDLNDLRKREIFEIPVFEVQELSLQIRASNSGTTNDLKVRLAKSKGKWIFETPLSAEADPALVSNTINTLAAVKVGRFVSGQAIDPVALGLDNPFMRVTLHGNKRRQTLIIGNLDNTRKQDAPFYYAKLESNPAILTVEARPFDELIQAQEALRERNFMDFADVPLDSIHISGEGAQLRLQKLENGRWQVLESSDDKELQPRRADNTVIEQLITDLAALRADEFAVDAPDNVDLERLGFNDPRRVVELFFDDDTSTRLEIAHPDDDDATLYARTDRAEFVYEVERRPTLNRLPLSPLHYRNRLLESLPEAASVQRIALIDSTCGVPIFDYQLERDGETWEIIFDALNETERSASKTLLAVIRNFSVSAYLNESFSPAGYLLEGDRMLPWQYRLEATILLPGSEKNKIRETAYVFTKRLSGTKQFGGSATHGTMFSIQQSTIDALYTLTDTMERPPEAIKADPQAPEAVEPVPEPAKIPAAEPIN